MHAVRDIGKADDAQLTGICEDTTRLLAEYEPFMGGDLVEALCLWRQAAKRQQERRATGLAVVKPLRAIQAS
ncbi:MAG TPA: hypothetical protein VN969_02995 [Streptosporangiaceae bacterium]|nr:hypothetical protein [Streptosporangiaceae bacterium]